MIKNILLGVKLFLNKPISNLILSIELVAVAVILLILSNVNAYSKACIDVLQSGDFRIMMCQNYNFDNNDMEEKLKTIQEKYKSVKGVSKLSDSFILFDKDNLIKEEGGEGAYIELLDDSTITSIQFPLSKGQWITPDLIDGKIPCVVGGINAKKYKIGQTIKGYTYAAEQEEDNLEIVEREFIVTGILSQPEIKLSLSFVSINIKLLASNLFVDYSNTELFLMASRNQVNITENYNTNGALLYIDKNTAEEEIESIRNDFSYGFTHTDNEFIRNENADVKQSIDIMLPFISILFLVVFCGIIAISMLTAIKNLDTFKIYYLVGCSKIKTIWIMVVYACCYFVTSGVIFYFFTRFLVYFSNESMHAKSAYFIINSNNIIFISGVCVAVLVLAFVIPFYIVKKQNIIDLLRKD